MTINEIANQANKQEAAVSEGASLELHLIFHCKSFLEKSDFDWSNGWRNHCPTCLHCIFHTFQLSIVLELVFTTRHSNAIGTYVSVTIRRLVGIALVVDALWIAVRQSVPDVFTFSVRVPTAFNLDRTGADSENKVFREFVATTWSGNSERVKFCVSHKRYFARIFLYVKKSPLHFSSSPLSVLMQTGFWFFPCGLSQRGDNWHAIQLISIQNTCNLCRWHNKAQLS